MLLYNDSLKEQVAQRVDWTDEMATELSSQLREHVLQKADQLVQRLKLQLEQCQSGGDSAAAVQAAAADRAERERSLKARAKVRELENQMRQLQEKLKQKEASLEAKSKELAKSQKSQESARGEIVKVDKQRESQESR